MRGRGGKQRRENKPETCSADQRGGGNEECLVKSKKKWPTILRGHVKEGNHQKKRERIRTNFQRHGLPEKTNEVRGNKKGRTLPRELRASGCWSIKRRGAFPNCEGGWDKLIKEASKMHRRSLGGWAF